MKKLCLLLFLSLAASARAEDPPSPTHSQIDKSAPARETVQAHVAPLQNQKSTTQTEVHARQTPLHVEKPALNETAHGRLKVDGILVQLVKTDNPTHQSGGAGTLRFSGR